MGRVQLCCGGVQVIATVALHSVLLVVAVWLLLVCACCVLLVRRWTDYCINRQAFDLWARAGVETTPHASRVGAWWARFARN